MGKGGERRSGEITGQFREISLHDPYISPPYIGHLGIPIIALADIHLAWLQSEMDSQSIGQQGLYRIVSIQTLLLLFVLINRNTNFRVFSKICSTVEHLFLAVVIEIKIPPPPYPSFCYFSPFLSPIFHLLLFVTFSCLHLHPHFRIHLYNLPFVNSSFS